MDAYCLFQLRRNTWLVISTLTPLAWRRLGNSKNEQLRDGSWRRKITTHHRILGYSTSCASNLRVHDTARPKVCKVQIFVEGGIVQECLEVIEVFIIWKGSCRSEALNRDPLYQMSAKKIPCKGPIVFIAAISISQWYCPGVRSSHYIRSTVFTSELGTGTSSAASSNCEQGCVSIFDLVRGVDKQCCQSMWPLKYS